MARLLSLLILLSLCVQTIGLHAKAPIEKSYDRFRRQCEDDGNGMACYSYGRALYNRGNKKEAVHYFARGCDMKYKLACASYKDHSTTTIRPRKRPKNDDGHGAICFHEKELNNAKLTPHPALKTGVQGMKISEIKPHSFWFKAGLKEGDVIARMNNMLFDTRQDIIHAFAVSGKTFGFEVVRDGDTIPVWYTCK